MIDRLFQGVINNYKPDKGFGFIRPDDRGEDLFFHIQDISDSALNEPTPGQRVAFDRMINPKNGKLRAFDVRAAATAPKPQG